MERLTEKWIGEMPAEKAEAYLRRVRGRSAETKIDDQADGEWQNAAVDDDGWAYSPVSPSSLHHGWNCVLLR